MTFFAIPKNIHFLDFANGTKKTTVSSFVKVITDRVWDQCLWYHSKSADLLGTLVCKQFTQAEAEEGHIICEKNGTHIDHMTRSNRLIGGLKAENQTCELLIFGGDM